MKIPAILHDLWPQVMDLKPNECLLLEGLGPATKQHLLLALRKAVRLTESAGLLQGCSIVFRARHCPGGSWNIYIQKISIPSVQRLSTSIMEVERAK